MKQHDPAVLIQQLAALLTHPALTLFMLLIVGVFLVRVRPWSALRDPARPPDLLPRILFALVGVILFFVNQLLAAHLTSTSATRPADVTLSFLLVAAMFEGLGIISILLFGVTRPRWLRLPARLRAALPSNTEQELIAGLAGVSLLLHLACTAWFSQAVPDNRLLMLGLMLMMTLVVLVNMVAWLASLRLPVPQSGWLIPLMLGLSLLSWLNFTHLFPVPFPLVLMGFLVHALAPSKMLEGYVKRRYINPSQS